MHDSPYFWLASQQSAMSHDLIALANQNSGSSHSVGLMAVADWLRTWMDLPGASFQAVPLPPRHMIDDQGQELAIESPPMLRWDWAPTASAGMPIDSKGSTDERLRRVLLAIHYDTVFPSDSPFQACTWLDSQRLNGPGVADAKGGIVVIRYALQALLQFGLLKNIGFSVLLNPDEEIGSPSSVGVFDEVAGEFDFGLLFEPALPGGSLVSQRKGSGNFTIVVRGRSAHAGRDMASGRNAIVHLSRLLLELEALNGQREGLTLNVGVVRGGSAFNVVPDLAIGRVNVRVAERESIAWVNEKFAELIEKANAVEGFQCQLHGGITSPPKLINDSQRQLMQVVEQAALAIGAPPVTWQATGGVCDGNKLAAAGLPNIDTLGPRGDRLHSVHEWVDVPSLVEKAQLVVNLLSRFDSGEFTT